MPIMLTPSGLIQLMTWLSPAFPVGSFSYSHGLEFAVEHGLVTSGATLCEWVEGIFRFGAGQSEALFFAEAWRAAEREDFDALLRINAYANAMRPTQELALENQTQGRSFVSMIQAIAALPTLRRLHQTLERSNEWVAYSVAVAVAAFDEDIELKPALTAFLHAFASNRVSAGIRLIPLGQTAGLQALAEINLSIPSVVERALSKSLDDMGSAVPMVDWTSAMHETQYTRLFRS